MAVNVSVDGVRVTTGADATVPVPVSVTLCGEPVALSARLTAAEKLPVEAGENTTEIMQLLPAASVVPQLLVCENTVALVPVIAMLVRLRVALLVLVNVTLCAALDVPELAVNVSVAGVMETVATVVPVTITLAIPVDPL